VYGLPLPFTGVEKRCSLRRPEQPDQGAAALQPVGRASDGGVLPTGRPGEGARHGRQRHVRQTHRIRRKVAGLSTFYIYSYISPAYTVAEDK